MINDDLYRHPAHRGEGYYKEKGSKFFSHAIPVWTEEEVKNELELVKTQYHDARHHCYAYVLGDKGESFRANDDGEPNHSAGDPILGQIRSFQLTYCLVVVVRYFGGTKLGVSGLIQAYKTAAEDALKKINIISAFPTYDLEIRFPYEDTNDVMRALEQVDYQLIHQDFGEACCYQIKIRKNQLTFFCSKFELKDKVQLIHQGSKG